MKNKIVELKKRLTEVADLMAALDDLEEAHDRFERCSSSVADAYNATSDALRMMEALAEIPSTLMKLQLAEMKAERDAAIRTAEYHRDAGSAAALEITKWSWKYFGAQRLSARHDMENRCLKRILKATRANKGIDGRTREAIEEWDLEFGEDPRDVDPREPV